MEENKNLLTINNLVVEYHSDEQIIHAVNGVNLSIGYGESLALVGETGAGKTTIAKSILRILPARQSRIISGEIMFEGCNLLSLKEHDMRDVRGNKISMIFQDPMTALNPVEKVGDQIAEAIHLHEKISKAEALLRAVDMLEMVGIPGERSIEYPHQFSGGMKQRVVIARALACKPELLLADEPTSALDVTIQAQVLDMIDTLKKKLNTSVLMITHDLGIVAQMCQKVAVIYAGEIVEYGSAEEIYDHRAHPYTIGLFGSLPRLDSKDKKLMAIKGIMPDPANLPSGCKFHDRCPYAKDICMKENPPAVEYCNNHIVKCFFPKESR